jgi:hypothetical protein
MDQLSQVVRYIVIQGGNVEIKESFLGFIPIPERKDAETLSNIIINELECDGLDIQNIRGQGYDNAATMSGIHQGVQKRILQKNPRALFVPCLNHSLNLVGVHAASTTAVSTTFFGTTERLFVFFSCSTHRWKIFQEKVPKTLRRLCDTRWSSRHDAVDVLASYLEGIIEALETLRDGPMETMETRGDAGALLVSILSYNFVVYLWFWNPVLKEIETAQKYLQTPSLSIDCAAVKLRALAAFIDEKREEIVKAAQEKASTFSEEMGIPTEQRIRRRKKMPGENSEDCALSIKDEARRQQQEILDKIYSEFQRRFQQLHEIHEKFAFLTDPTFLLGDDKTQNTYAMIDSLCTLYDEINSSDFKEEIGRFRRLIQSFHDNLKPDISKWNATDTLKWIVEWGYQETIPNFCIALRIFLTMSVSIASCERSFSKLKLIKMYLRSTMSEARLNSLAILSIERERASQCNFDTIIRDFADFKARKVSI